MPSSSSASDIVAGQAVRRRSVALVGPQGSGKSTLFAALMAAAGQPVKRSEGRGQAVALGHCGFMGEPWSMVDCPGSIEFAFEAAGALGVVDLAVVVAEPVPERAVVIGPLLKDLAERGIPHLLFINRIDTLTGTVRDVLAAYQAVSPRPLALRQVPIRDGETVTGYVDVVSERAYRYRKGQPSELITLPSQVEEREKEARGALLELLADHDDGILEKILEDVQPSTDEIFRQLHKDQAAGAIVEVLLGAADRDHGVRRLWKALRHDTPGPAETAAARGIDAAGDALLQVFKTAHVPHSGKLSYARVWRGPVKDGAALGAVRVGGILQFPGGEQQKLAEADAGDLVALARLEGVPTGAVLAAAGEPLPLPFPTPPQPVYAMAITTADRKDDVKLSGALQKLAEEDPSLRIDHMPDTGETVLHGQGEIHLTATIDRLAKVYNLRLTTTRPQVAYKETIRKAVPRQHARLKRQTGGHGQFADVVIAVEPRPRGTGFQFTDQIVGGAVPRQYIPAVGEAAEEATRKGPFGYPVVDVHVTLLDGGFHTVDSSDMAFKTATRMAMQEALAKADPVLLEPIDHVAVSVPADYTAKAQRLLSGHNGQILGYAERPGWPGWDVVEALVPEAELHDLIIELRSQTLGLGSFVRRFDHLAEARGAFADRLIKEAKAAGG